MTVADRLFRAVGAPSPPLPFSFFPCCHLSNKKAEPKRKETPNLKSLLTTQFFYSFFFSLSLSHHQQRHALYWQHALGSSLAKLICDGTGNDTGWYQCSFDWRLRSCGDGEIDGKGVVKTSANGIEDFFLGGVCTADEDCFEMGSVAQDITLIGYRCDGIGEG